MKSITVHYTDGTKENFQIDNIANASRDNDGITITESVEIDGETKTVVTFIPNTSIKKIVQVV